MHPQNLSTRESEIERAQRTLDEERQMMRFASLLASLAPAYAHFQVMRGLPNTTHHAPPQHHTPHTNFHTAAHSAKSDASRCVPLFCAAHQRRHRGPALLEHHRRHARDEHQSQPVDELGRHVLAPPTCG
eukprot:869311-Prymnesium_polylepis.2